MEQDDGEGAVKQQDHLARELSGLLRGSLFLEN